MDDRQKNVFLFAGQGCHYPRMGVKLFEQEPIYREVLFQADRLLGKWGGPPLLDHLLDESDGWMIDLSISHPAIFAVQWAMFELLLDRGIRPDACVGLSLGEYVAVGASLSVPFLDMFSLVKAQAIAVEQHLPAGGLMTVLASHQLFNDRPELFAGCTLAAENFPGHMVVSGRKKELATSQELLEKQGISALPLSVPYAFHSPDVQFAKSSFLKNLQNISFSQPEVSLYSCSQNRKIIQPNAEYLWQIVENSINFSQTISQVERDLSMPRYIDCSPSGTLATFMKYLLTPKEHHRVLTYREGELVSVVSRY
jgi:acyl transferase domain-containing protein